MNLGKIAYEIIKKNGNIPMSVNEVWHIIEKEKLYTGKGKTPRETLSSQLGSMAINSGHKDKVKDQLFEIVGSRPQKFKILDGKINNTTLIIPSPSNHIFEFVIDYNSVNKCLISEKNDSIMFDVEPCDTFTYIMIDNIQKQIKIGVSKNVNSRLSQLRTSNSRLEIILVFPSTYFSEGDLHAKFDNDRDELEFFFHTRAIKEFIYKETKKREAAIKCYEGHLKQIELNKELLKLFN